MEARFYSNIISRTEFCFFTEITWQILRDPGHNQRKKTEIAQNQVCFKSKQWLLAQYLPNLFRYLWECYFSILSHLASLASLKIVDGKSGESGNFGNCSLLHVQNQIFLCLQWSILPCQTCHSCHTCLICKTL